MKARKYEKPPMTNDERIAILETTIININSTLVDIKHDMTRLSDRMDVKFDSLDKKIDNINNRLWSNFLWLMGMIIGLAGLIAHAMHWI